MIDPRKIKKSWWGGGGGTQVCYKHRLWTKRSLNMAQEALGSDKGSNSFQTMEQRKALACAMSVR